MNKGEQQPQRAPLPHEVLVILWRRGAVEPDGPFVFEKDDALRLMKEIDQDGGLDPDKRYRVNSVIMPNGRQQAFYFTEVTMLMVDRALGLVPAQISQKTH